MPSSTYLNFTQNIWTFSCRWLPHFWRKFVATVPKTQLHSPLQTRQAKKPNIQFFSFFLSSIHLGGFYRASRRRRRRRRRRRVDPAAHAPEWLQPLTRVTLTDAAAADLSLSLSLLVPASQAQEGSEPRSMRSGLIDWMNEIERSIVLPAQLRRRRASWLGSGRPASGGAVLAAEQSKWIESSWNSILDPDKWRQFLISWPVVLCVLPSLQDLIGASLRNSSGCNCNQVQKLFWMQKGLWYKILSH